MANRKNLKKDINWLTQEVVSDCLMYLDFNNVADEQPVANIINSMIVKRNELVSRLNMPTSNVSRTDVKEEYRNIVKDLFETSNSCLEQLSKLPRK